MTGRVAGKVVLITGTGGGQGRAAAQLFAREGAIVAGCDVNPTGAAETVDLVTSAGGQMTSNHPIDLADREAVSRWVDDVVDRYGRIDILYNNASAPKFGSIAEMTPADWHSTQRNELDVVFHMTQCVWPHLVAGGGGAIVNIASMQGISAIRPAAGGFAHATTKHGIIGMTRELANEGGPHGIRVNAISPGIIETPAVAPLVSMPEVVDAFLAHQVIKRLGRPEEVASAALFLASDEAGFITGTNLVVDGGYTIV